jgi:hypothetical protein
LLFLLLRNVVIWSWYDFLKREEIRWSQRCLPQVVRMPTLATTDSTVIELWSLGVGHVTSRITEDLLFERTSQDLPLAKKVKNVHIRKLCHQFQWFRCTNWSRTDADLNCTQFSRRSERFILLVSFSGCRQLPFCLQPVQTLDWLDGCFFNNCWVVENRVLSQTGA